jgi:hypothetical protein
VITLRFEIFVCPKMLKRKERWEQPHRAQKIDDRSEQALAGTT